MRWTELYKLPEGTSVLIDKRHEGVIHSYGKDRYLLHNLCDLEGNKDADNYLGNFEYSWWLGNNVERDSGNVHLRLTINTNAKRRLL